MAERPKVTTRVFARDELAALFGGNMRAVKAFEALGLDVSGTLPNASLANAEAAEGAQTTADQAVLDAEAAQQTAEQAAQAASTAQQAADDAQQDIDDHEALTAAHGTTGDVVGTTDTQTLTNKTLGSALTLSGQTLNTGVNAPTLGSNLPGPAGDPVTWCQVNINGTDYWMPLWAA